MINILDGSLPPVYRVLFIVMSFILGAVIGSFLNVVIIRVPRHEPVTGIKNRSHCMSCGKQLRNIDLIPVLSYIFLGGKCRFCKAHISARYWIVELITAVVFTLSLLVCGISVRLLFAFILVPVLVVASGIDIDRMEIPNGCSLIIALLGLAATIVCGATGNDSIIAGAADGMGIAWWEHLIGAVAVSVPFAVMMMFGAMGGGDVLLMASAGFLLGWKTVIVAAAVGIVLGAAGGGLELLSVPRGLKKKASEVSKRVAEEWYEKQKENGIYVIEGKSDAVFGSIFKGRSDIETECLDAKCWNGTPDIKSLNEALDAELSEVSKFGISIVISNVPDKKHPDADHDPLGKVETVTCKRQVVFGPYLSVGIITAFLIGYRIIGWYFGFIGV